MDPIRGTIQLDLKMVTLLKRISQDTGIPVAQLVNLCIYDLGRRFGYIIPHPRYIPPPAGIDIFERAVPHPPPQRKAARPGGLAKAGAAARNAVVPPTRKSAQEVLYMQIENKAPVAVRKTAFLIGRGSKCDLIIDSRSVSREHAVITRERGGWFIQDLESANGTWLRNEAISKHKLQHGDRIQISNLNLRFTFRTA